MLPGAALHFNRTGACGGALEDAKCIDPTSPTLPLKIPRGPPALWLLRERNVYMRIETNRTPSRFRHPRLLSTFLFFSFCFHRNQNPAYDPANVRTLRSDSGVRNRRSEDEFGDTDRRNGIVHSLCVQIRVAKTRDFARRIDRARGRERLIRVA